MSTDFVLSKKLVLETWDYQMTILNNLYCKIRLNSKAYSDFNQKIKTEVSVKIVNSSILDIWLGLNAVLGVVSILTYWQPKFPSYKNNAI